MIFRAYLREYWLMMGKVMDVLRVEMDLTVG